MELSVVSSAPALVQPQPAERIFTRPGQSASAVGQQAKVVIAMAKSSGIELPRAGQGAAASTIAQGADPASVFSAIAASVLELPKPVIPFPDRAYALDFLNDEAGSEEAAKLEREVDAA